MTIKQISDDLMTFRLKVQKLRLAMQPAIASFASANACVDKVTGILKQKNTPKNKAALLTNERNLLTTYKEKMEEMLTDQKEVWEPLLNELERLKQTINTKQNCVVEDLKMLEEGRKALSDSYNSLIEAYKVIEENIKSFNDVLEMISEHIKTYEIEDKLTNLKISDGKGKLLNGTKFGKNDMPQVVTNNNLEKVKVVRPL